MATFAAGAAPQSESQRIGGGVTIVVNAIADTLGLERSSAGVGGGTPVTAAQLAAAAAALVTAAPAVGVPQRPDVVQQMMATTDP